MTYLATDAELAVLERLRRQRALLHLASAVMFGFGVGGVGVTLTLWALGGVGSVGLWPLTGGVALTAALGFRRWQARLGLEAHRICARIRERGR